MKLLPLYENAKPGAVASEKVNQALWRECDKCALHKHAETICMPGTIARNAGDAPILLVVGEFPSRDCDAIGVPFKGRANKMAVERVLRHWEGSVVLENAVRCAPGSKKVTPTMVSRCRPYLGDVINKVKPARILALGSLAAFGLMGRSVSPMGTRRGYSYLSDGTLVMYLLPPLHATRNRWVQQWFDADIEWALTTTPPEPKWDAQVQVVVTPDDAATAVRQLELGDWASFDVETSGKMWTGTFEVISIAATAKGSWESYVWDTSALRNRATLKPLLDYLASSSNHKVAQNGKYDQLAILDAFDTHVSSVIGDTRLWRKLLAPEAPAKLTAMAELVGMGGCKEEAEVHMAKAKRKIQGALRKGEEHEGPLLDTMPPDVEAAIRLGDPIEKYLYRLLPDDMLARYNARDAVVTARLAEALEQEMAAEPNLQRTWDTIVAPAAEGLVWVEHWGIGVDFAQVQRFDDHLARREVELGNRLAQYDVNWKSHPQVADLLFNELKLRPIKMTPAGKPSTDAETLEKLRNRHHVPGDLLDYRFVQKMRSTYAVGMREHIRPDGRIHPNIKLAGARSGRTSCTDPNLQNIPRGNSSPEGKMARDCFVAPPGFTLIELDYSQLELRVAAMLSGDPEMRAIFDEGVDYHQRTAELVSKIAWGIEPDKVEKKHRSQAKTINFGVLYGMGDKALAARMGCGVGQAIRTREAIMGRFKLLNKWCRAQLTEAKRTGEIWTWWDGQRARRRPMFRVADADDHSRSVAEHGSWNTPVQGTASDFCIRSLGECVDWILEDELEDDVKLVLTVHDSIMFEARNNMVDEVVGTARAIMQSWPSYGVPLVVDAAVGQAWGSLKEIANA